MDFTIRKTCTKTHNIKVENKQFITFAHYRTMLVGKYDLTYTKAVDIIEDVTDGLKERGYASITYYVKDVKTGEKRTHGTFIHPKEISVINRWAK